MKPTSIFFDKDGTLLDFDAFWISTTRSALRDILAEFDTENRNHTDDDIDCILSLLGVENNEIDIDGILCKGTYEEIAEVISDYLKSKGIRSDSDKMRNNVINAYNNNIDNGCIKPTCDNIKEILTTLKAMGIHLCVITTDNPEITHKCLNTIGILEFFEYVYTDDGVTAPKPSDECITKYCNETGITRDEILMVGDTMTDMNFAANAGIKVIAVGNEKNINKLAKHADAVMPNVSYIIETLKEMN